MIPRRDDQLDQRGRPAAFGRAAYRRRNAVERCAGWLRAHRRLGTRHDKLAVSYLALVRLATIRRGSRVMRL